MSDSDKGDVTALGWFPTLARHCTIPMKVGHAHLSWKVVPSDNDSLAVPPPVPAFLRLTILGAYLLQHSTKRKEKYVNATTKHQTRHDRLLTSSKTLVIYL